MQALISSPPDGYTLGLVGSSVAVNATLFQSLPFNVLREIAPIAGLARLPMVMVVSPSVPAATVAEFIAYAMANPGKIDMASFGAGTHSHLVGELFKSMTGVKLNHVPYRGSAPAHIDMFSGRVHVMFDTLTASLTHIRGGALRALAVTGEVRYAALPDVPILADTVPGFAAEAWNGLAAPRATPAEIIERLNRVINAGLTDTTVKAHLAEIATTPFVATPAEFGAYIAAETERWGNVIRAAGIKAE
jgi:tripartite-type tricarboxylate transporter receptor subunit TctC